MAGVPENVARSSSESEPMKILLTASSSNIDSDVDPRFGRAAYLLVINTETNEWEAQTNPGLSVSGGAGIQAAQFAAKQQIEAAISGDFGPHAYEALQTAGIAMYLYGDCHTVREAIERFKAGLLRQIGAPTRGDCDGGHHRHGH
jgi:predicted Fe-Mo cluster-binding NifX family protein